VRGARENEIISIYLLAERIPCFTVLGMASYCNRGKAIARYRYVRKFLRYLRDFLATRNAHTTRRNLCSLEAAMTNPSHSQQKRIAAQKGEL